MRIWTVDTSGILRGSSERVHTHYSIKLVEHHTYVCRHTAHELVQVCSEVQCRPTRKYGAKCLWLVLGAMGSYGPI
jgi:hypothetical protein